MPYWYKLSGRIGFYWRRGVPEGWTFKYSQRVREVFTSPEKSICFRGSGKSSRDCPSSEHWDYWREPCQRVSSSGHRDTFACPWGKPKTDEGFWGESSSNRGFLSWRQQNYTSERWVTDRDSDTFSTSKNRCCFQ